jgi:RimJ/RimL family protein N-acetyltransferase
LFKTEGPATIPSMSSSNIGPKRPPSRIEFANLRLAPLTVAHTREMVERVGESLSELRKFMHWSHFPQTLDSQFERLIRVQADYWCGQDYGLGIFAADTGKLLGSTGLHRRMLNPHGYEIGYWVATSEAGRGFATTSTQMLIALLFEYFSCERVQISTNEKNIASQRVIEKCGFIPEATLRNFVMAKPTPEMIQNGWQGAPRELLYALTPEDRVNLPWYPRLRRGLRIWNFEGQELPTLN